MEGESLRSPSSRVDHSHRATREASRAWHSGAQRRSVPSSRHRSLSAHERYHRYKLQRDGDTDTETETVRSVSMRVPSLRAEDRRCDDGAEIPLRDGGGSVEVQLIPQNDDWCDRTTVITGVTSETGFSMRGDDATPFGGPSDRPEISATCAKYSWMVLAGVIGTVAFLSPLVMVLLPRLGLRDWHSIGECKPECEALLIGFAFKLLILAIGTWALFFRRPSSTLPRICVLRAIVLLLIIILLVAFWLFYGVRIYLVREESYHSVVLFAVSFVDVLLFIHYLAIVLLAIRQLQAQFVVKVIRSPDGVSRCYTIGQMSVQRCAAWCLERYFRDFPVYNPYLDNVPRNRVRNSAEKSDFKIYDIDTGVTTQASQPESRGHAVLMASGAGGHNEHFYEQEDYERRVKKRCSRLIVAAEESFTHIKRLRTGYRGPGMQMTPIEAAQSIFPTLAHALKKYLRVTRQQPRYSTENILQHLATCISYDMGPKSFLERYLSQGAVIWNDKDYRSTCNWSIVCQQLLSCSLEHGSVFQLRSGDIFLFVSVRKLPHFNLTEEVIDPKKNKFVLGGGSETPV